MRRFLALLLLVWNLCGQSQTGELRITVSDPAGAPVAAAAELTSDVSGTRLEVTLHSDGTYVFRGLPFGIYQLKLSNPGFADAVETVQIRSGVPLERHASLAVRAVQTALVVEERETLVDPERTNSAAYISAQALRERAAGSPGRGVLNLLAMQPGWTFEANSILHPRESEYDTQFVIDGFPVYDNRSPAFAPAAEADNVQSVRAFTGGIPAEFGQKLGGVVEINTQPNSSPGFHGSAALQGGSFETVDGFVTGQLSIRRTSASFALQGFSTERYLDPPTTSNNNNHGSNGSLTAGLERDFNDTNRLRIAFDRRNTWFQVPGNLVEEAAGQRQDRTSINTEGRVSWQHVFSPALLGNLRGQVRDVQAKLWSNPLSTPISAAQDRGYREGYVNGSLAGHRGRHEWKTGVEARWASIDEQFGFHILQYRLNPGNVRVFDRDLPANFQFTGHAPDREQSFYVQDTMRLGNFTINAGLRFDHYRLLVDETGWSPRLSGAWHSERLGLLVHASYDRTFGTPPFENVLVSASPATRFEGVYLPLRPSRGNYYEAGLTKTLGRHVRFDATWFRREVDNFGDDEPLLNTGVSFPINFSHATVRGVEARLEVPRWGRFSGYLNYSNTIGLGRLPLAGGLFLDDDDQALLHSTETFTISQDLRNTAHGRVRYQILPRLWTAWTGAYSSGLPVEGDLPPRAFLAAQFGEDVVNLVNFRRGRVHPSFELSMSLGADLWKAEKRSVSLQFDAENITDRLNLINFAGLLSGTAVAPQRRFGLRLRTDF